MIIDDQGQNRIRFGDDISPNDLSAGLSTQAGQTALTLRVAGVELATLTQGFNSFDFEFAGGARLTANAFLLDYQTGIDNVNGSDNDDTLLGSQTSNSLYGHAGNDTLWGGRGDDVLEGGLGDDDYRYRRGDGHDVIQETDDLNQASQDRVTFGAGIALSDVDFNRRPNGDLSVTVAGLRDAVTITGWYSDSANRVESFVFADGQTVTADTLLTREVAPETGTDGNDELIGSDYRDILLAGAGDDRLIGKGGDDDLHGESGTDRYRFTPGGGADQVFEVAGETSLIEVNGFELSRLSGARVGDDLRLEVSGAADSMTLNNFYTLAHDWQVTAGNGVTQALNALLADNEAYRAGQSELERLQDAFQAHIADAVIQGNREAGMIQQADGSWLTELQLQVSKTIDNYARAEGYSGWLPSDNTYYNLSGHHGLTVGGLNVSAYAGDDATINHVDKTSSYLSKNVQVNWGTPQTVSGSQLYTASTGHYLYTQEELLALQAALGVNGIANPYVYTETPQYTRTSTTTTRAAAAVSSTDADGTGYDIAGANAESLYHLGSLPTNLAITADNRMADLTILNGGDGDNVINYNGDFGIVHGGAGNDSIKANATGLYLDNQYLRGQTLLDGGFGDDVIVGGWNEDQLVGGHGDDMLRGEGGEDRYYFLAGDSGTDLVYDVAYGGSLENDSVVFGEDISLSDLSFSWGSELLPIYSYGSYDESQVRWFQTLDISWQAGSVARVVMSTAFINDYGQIVESNDYEQTGIELFEFADGSSLTMEQLLALPGVPERPVVDRFGNILLGTADADQLTGQDGPDDLYGRLGDDTLIGNDGDDWLFGGAGNDRLAGGSGSDRYFFDSEDTGTDLLYDIGDAGNIDTVVFGQGIDLSEFSFSWGSEILSPFNDGNFQWFQTLDIAWQADSIIRIVMQRADADSGLNTGVEFFEFADGSRLTLAQMLTLVGPSSQHAPVLNSPLADQAAMVAHLRDF